MARANILFVDDIVVRFSNLYGVFKIQRCLSLSASKLSSVAKLLLIAERAMDCLEFGIDLGMMRHVPSGS